MDLHGHELKRSASKVEVLEYNKSSCTPQKAPPKMQFLSTRTFTFKDASQKMQFLSTIQILVKMQFLSTIQILVKMQLLSTIQVLVRMQFLSTIQVLVKMQFVSTITLTCPGKSVPEATKCKVGENPHNSGRHRTKIGPNPNVLA